MKDHLPEADLEKLRTVLAIKEAYQKGELSLEQAQKELREKVVRLRPYEIALAEQELKTLEEDECRKEDIQGMMALFREVMDTSRPQDLEEDHPIMCYYRENDAIRSVLKEIEKQATRPIIKNQWLALYDQLATFKTHLARKQNQLYSILERKGFDRPTTTMWLLDDFIRDEINDARKLIEEDREEEFIAMQKTIVEDVLDLMQKEETVLYPTSLAMITPNEFEEMKLGDHEIGFALISVKKIEQLQHRWGSETSTPTNQRGSIDSNFLADLANLLGKHGYGTGTQSDSSSLLDVANGKMTLEQINLVFRHMQVDFSYVDESEIVRFYNDSSHRVFPRSKNVIGRDVKNCHPRTSVHLVEEIIEKFRSGEESSVDFWINKPGLFIYISYVAVRDEQGKFRGVLEMMQNATRIRELEGSRTLLTWSESTEAAEKQQRSNASSSPENNEQTQEQHSPTSETIAIGPDTRLKDLLDTYPHLKGDLRNIHPAFKMLQSPLARIIVPKATIRMMSERSGMPLEALIQAIKDKI